MRRLLIMAALALLCASARAETWTYKQKLTDTATYVRYEWWHGWSLRGSGSLYMSDSVYFSFSTTGMDTTINWVDIKITWDGYDSSQSNREFRGNWWAANGTSYYYPIRQHWCDPPQYVVRQIRFMDTLAYTDTIGSATDTTSRVYSDIDSVLIDDTLFVELRYSEYWPGGLVSGFTEVVPTMSPYSTSEIIVDTVYDTTWTLAPPARDNWVNAYIDLAVIQYDSTLGRQVPLNRAQVTLQLIGKQGINDGSVGLVPLRYQGEPVDGRVVFQVPANTILSPAGSYYMLTYRTYGATMSSGVLKRFWLDTIPVTMNILDAEEPW